MSDTDIDGAGEDYATPEGTEVFQAEEPSPAVPVEFVAPQPVKLVGGRESSYRLFFLSVAAPPVQIVTDDPRRTTVTIIPLDGDIRLSSAPDISTASAILPVGVPLSLNTSDAIWANMVAGSGNVTVIAEFWAR